MKPNKLPLAQRVNGVLTHPVIIVVTLVVISISWAVTQLPSIQAGIYYLNNTDTLIPVLWLNGDIVLTPDVAEYYYVPYIATWFPYLHIFIANITGLSIESVEFIRIFIQIVLGFLILFTVGLVISRNALIGLLTALWWPFIVTLRHEFGYGAVYHFGWAGALGLFAGVIAIFLFGMWLKFSNTRWRLMLYISGGVLFNFHPTWAVVLLLTFGVGDLVAHFEARRPVKALFGQLVVPSVIAILMTLPGLYLFLNARNQIGGGTYDVELWWKLMEFRKEHHIFPWENFPPYIAYMLITLLLIHWNRHQLMPAIALRLMTTWLLVLLIILATFIGVEWFRSPTVASAVLTRISVFMSPIGLILALMLFLEFKELPVTNLTVEDWFIAALIPVLLFWGVDPMLLLPQHMANLWVLPTMILLTMGAGVYLWWYHPTKMPILKWVLYGLVLVSVVLPLVISQSELSILVLVALTAVGLLRAWHSQRPAMPAKNYLTLGYASLIATNLVLALVLRYLYNIGGVSTRAMLFVVILAMGGSLILWLFRERQQQIRWLGSWSDAYKMVSYTAMWFFVLVMLGTTIYNVPQAIHDAQDDNWASHPHHKDWLAMLEWVHATTAPDDLFLLPPDIMQSVGTLRRPRIIDNKALGNSVYVKPLVAFEDKALREIYGINLTTTPMAELLRYGNSNNLMLSRYIAIDEARVAQIQEAYPNLKYLVKYQPELQTMVVQNLALRNEITASQLDLPIAYQNVSYIVYDLRTVPNSSTLE